MADWVEDSFASRGEPKNPNYCFEYRNINHVEPVANYEDEEEFKQSIIKKYEESDAREAPLPGPRIPMHDLKPNFRELRTEIHSAKPTSIHERGSIPENPLIEADQNE